MQVNQFLSHGADLNFLWSHRNCFLNSGFLYGNPAWKLSKRKTKKIVWFSFYFHSFQLFVIFSRFAQSNTSTFDFRTRYSRLKFFWTVIKGSDQSSEVDNNFSKPQRSEIFSRRFFRPFDPSTWRVLQQV